MSLSKSFVAAAVIQIFTIMSSWGDIILTVDVSDPSNVIFTSTGAFSQVDESRLQNDGITLIDLFVTSPANNTSFSGTLTPAGSGRAFTTNFVNAPNDYNLFGGLGGPTMTFSTTAPAFTGQGFDDLSFATLASPGTVGDIRTGFNDGNFGSVIGQYSIVPEPTTGVLFLLGGLTLARGRRRPQLT